NPLPDANLTVPVFAACEENPNEGLFDLNEVTPVITNGHSGYIVSYYTSPTDAQNGTGTPLDTTVDYLSQDATLYAAITDALTGCKIVASFTLDVQTAPIIPSVPVLNECDFNNDEVAPFYLQQVIDDMVAYFGAGVTVTLHETREDAEYQQGTNPITNLTDYTNVNAALTGGVQIIYVRVSNATGCFDVEEVRLVAHPVPVATDPLEAYHVCDDGASDTDGVATFNLNSYNTTVLNTINPADFTVTYHTTRAEAEAGTPVIATPGTYQSATGSVFVRVTNNVTGCYDLVELELVVDPLPVANQPTPLTLCDENTPGDEQEQFDLTSKINEITGGVLGVNVTFYTSLTDAQAGINQITNPRTYTNTVRNGVESIFVRVADAVTDCYRIVLLDIRVSPLPQLTQPTADQLTVCDTDGSGYGQFDLTTLEDIMINNGVNLTLAFYHTAYDADHGLNAITNPAAYTNIIPGRETIYVVATDSATGCQSQSYPITLIVAPAPRAVRLQDLTKCDDTDNNGQDYRLVFDLTQQNTVIETQLGVTAGALTIYYYTTEADANAGTPRITAPESFLATADGQEVWVRIENPANNCYQVASFELRINQPQELAAASMFTKCNDGAANIQRAEFNLTLKNDYILTPTGIGEGNIVEYFVSAAAMTANTPITTATAYTNTSNPQDLYVRVTTPQGCTSTTFLTLRVLPQPTPNTNPEPQELCDTQTNGYGYEEFNLSLASRRILANDSRSVISYYETQADAEAGTNAIPTVVNTAGVTTTPYINTTPWNQIVYARVALAGSEVADPSCVQVVAQELVVNPLPPVYDPATGDIKDYAICSPNSTGTETFRLMDFVRGVLTDAGENPNDYLVRFYFDMTAYNNGTALPHVYTNTVPNHQTIVVQVRNTVTDCFILADMNLYAEQAAVANAAATNPWIVCDDDGTNDGEHLFDLTAQDASILGSQSTAMFRVEYYRTQAAALLADTTDLTTYIADPVNFVNQSNPQTIWATVKNFTSHAPCIDVTSFEIGVELLAEPEISTTGDNHTLCMVYNGAAIDPLPLSVNLPVGSYTFTWYLGGREIATDLVSNVYNANEPGFYSVVATSTTAQQCVSEPSAEFEVIQSGPAQAIDGNKPYAISAAFSANQTITVLAEGYGEYQYSLGPDGPWQNSNVFENVPLGYFDIYVRDTKTDNPCTDYVIEGVSIIDYPKFFTPNGDGYNDYWNIQGMTHNGYEDAKIFIFDRYGKLIKQLNPLSRTDEGEGWDGTFNGKELPSDDYWFLVEFTENGQTREFRAHFAMKR
ncbi:MAG: T9SS type B sorting domain-containing protein, partial [Bacteroidia bacterium]